MHQARPPTPRFCPVGSTVIGPSTVNSGSLIKEIAADDPAFVFSDDRVKARMSQQSRQQTARYFW